MREQASTAIKGMSEDASFICRMNIRSEKELHRMIEDLSEEYSRTKKSTSGQYCIALFLHSSLGLLQF